jgi:hypothetical protein
MMRSGAFISQSLPDRNTAGVPVRISRTRLALHLVDRQVQHLNIPLNIEPVLIGLAAHAIEPPFSIRIGVGQRDVVRQGRVGAHELSGRDAVEVGDGLEPFDPADLLAQSHRLAGLRIELEFHQIAQHAGGELGEADAPRALALIEQPEMRGCVNPVHWQPRRKTRSPIRDDIRLNHRQSQSIIASD